MVFDVSGGGREEEAAMRVGIDLLLLIFLIVCAGLVAVLVFKSLMLVELAFFSARACATARRMVWLCASGKREGRYGCRSEGV